MRTLALPALAPASVLSACIGGYSDDALIARLKTAEAVLVANAMQYDNLAKSNSLHLMPRLTAVEAATQEELESLYTDQMSATRGAGRSYYDVIRNASANGKCPLCGVGYVTVIDHHLPKSKYPDLAVCPFNLVPACDFCNNAKRAQFPRTPEEQTIHPYYDDFTKDQWIFAKLETASSPTLIYYVAPPNNWPELNQKKAHRHFKVVKLGLIFTSNANDEMITLRDHLALIASAKGASGVQAYLLEEWRRYLVWPNSWQHAMYQSLAANTWFLSGGYLQIPR